MSSKAQETPVTGRGKRRTIEVRSNVTDENLSRFALLIDVKKTHVYDTKNQCIVSSFEIVELLNSME